MQSSRIVGLRRTRRSHSKTFFLEDDTGMRKKSGYGKLMGFCVQAVRDGYDHVWIDTCCINKENSAELSEAINSMYEWYKRSAVCYAYLADVSNDDSLQEDPEKCGPFRRSQWLKSDWFTRGWTLQEMIAPPVVKFYTLDWTFIGTKPAMADHIWEKTNIDVEVLKNEFNVQISVAKKMSWAEGRKTGKIEDRAYSLMGLFGVNMPTLYGEGSRAFLRLQEEIMRTTWDHSLFAWQTEPSSSRLLASSPDDFSKSKELASVGYDDYATWFRNQNPTPEYTLTNSGMRIQLPLEQTNDRRVFRAYLACTSRSQSSPNSRTWEYIKLKKKLSTFVVDEYERIHASDTSIEMTECQPHIQFRDIYISNDPNPIASSIPVFEVDFKVEGIQVNSGSHFKFSPETLQYYQGTVIKTPLQPSFTVPFRRNKEDQFVVLHTGSMILSNIGHPERREIFVLLGFHKGRPWTDIHVPKSTVQDTSQHITNIYWLYQNPNENAGNARLEHRLYTRKQVFSGYPNSATRMYSGRHSEQFISVEGDERSIEPYRALVKFTWR